jgi:hypothetical protein
MTYDLTDKNKWELVPLKILQEPTDDARCVCGSYWVVTAYCSSKELKELGLIADYGYSKKDNLSIIDTTIVDKWNNEYRVATIQNYSAFMDSYLYIVFGLLRR